MVGLGWFPDHGGGLERYTADLHLALGEVGDQIPTTVVLGPVADPPPGVVVAMATHSGAPWQRVVAMAATVTQNRDGHDLVDSHFALTGWLATNRTLVEGRPLVVHFQGPWASEQLDGAAPTEVGLRARAGFLLRRHIERSVHRRADLVITLSAAFANIAIEHSNVSPWRVVVEPPGVDLVRFSPPSGPAASAALRQRFGIAPDVFVAVCARRLVPRTGVDVAIDAWARLREQLPADRPTPVLLIAGDGPERAALDAQALDAGLDCPDAIRFLGRVDDHELVGLYQLADCSLVPTRSLEGFGLVILESLACGTPAIGTATGGIPEAFAGLERHQLVVEPGNPDRLAERLLAAIDGSRALPTTDECRTHAERFSWTAVATRHLAHYTRVVAEATPHPLDPWTGPERRRQTPHELSERLRVVALDHVARWSGGEIALARTLPHLPRSHVHTIVFEDGPLVGALARSGLTTEVLPLAPKARDLRRSRTASPGALLVSAFEAGRFTVRLAWRLRQLQPDVVHANSLKAGVLGGVACRLVGVPMVWHVRDRITTDDLPAPAVLVTRAAVRHLSAGVVANSHATLATLGPARPAQPRLVFPDPYLSSSNTPAHPASSAPFTIAMVGRLTPWKGHDVALRAFAECAEVLDRADGTTGRARLLIAGSALFGEDRYARELHQLAEALGIEDRLTWQGQVEDIPGLLAESHVLVHASVQTEPFGQVIVEGLAAGVAVIATDTGGPAEILVPGVTGILVPPGDPHALADALTALSADRERRELLAQNGMRAARAYHPDLVVPHLADFHRRVATASRPVPRRSAMPTTGDPRTGDPTTGDPTARRPAAGGPSGIATPAIEQ